MTERMHLYIPDTQIKPGVPLDHLRALSQLVVEELPDVIVCGGDWWDMSCLSSYDEGKRAMEGQRYYDDIAAGNDAMDVFLDPIRAFMDRYDYEPEMYFTIGNHEERIERFAENNPKFEGWISFNDLNLDDWQVYDYLDILEVDGIHYSHYFTNPFTGRPYGGSIVNKLNKLKFSFVQGHVQKYEHAVDYLNNGNVVSGMTAGAFYMHNERYKGPQGNNHFRGVIKLHGVSNGNYDPEVISIDRLLREYG